MAGLEAVAAVATIIDVLYPMFQSTLASLKRHMTSLDLSDDLLILEEVMSSIPDLIRVAESRYTNSSGVRHFVPKLRKLAYAAEDLVDELSYHELQKQVLEQAKGHATEGKKRKRAAEVLSNLIRGSTSTSITPERIQSLIKDLKRVIRRLKKAFDVANMLPTSVSPTIGNTVIASHRVTTSTIDLKRVRGREAEKQQMIEFLTPGPPIHDKKVVFFALTGIGGVGKTTLAQYAFNNVKDRFDLAVWICVSDAFDRKRLLQEIIAGIEAPSQREVIGFDTLESTIKREVKDKTLLLVLDDVWSTEWMDLLPPLKFSEAQCCKVIVTTREVKNIKQTRDYESKMLSLVGLQGEEYKMLFEEQAFGDEDPTEHPVLRCIGEKIASKLKGNPLAAKTVGAVLRENLGIQHWNRVVEDNLWNLGDKPEDIMPALMLSYLHLPPHLRRCFSYCALFPQDYKFDPKRLVWMWIAQGYVICTNPNERLEDVGLKYIRELESRSFFAKHTNMIDMSQGNRKIDIYSMHDLVHDLATFVSLNECFMYQEGSSLSNEKALSCHHLSVNQSNLHRLPADLPRIRTLICTEDDPLSDMKPLVLEVLKSLKNVRVLVGIETLLINYSDLGHLIHLRYLDLENMYSLEIYEPLLKSICSLYHLQTLLIYSRCWSEHIEYPNGMNNLINLRHLRGNLESIAKLGCIGKLVQLQEFLEFEVGKGSLHNIGQLKEMNQLHDELTISNICRVEAVDDAKNANMEMKKYLTSLNLQWCFYDQTCCCKDSTIEHHDNVLKYLKPHNSLENLSILNHKGSKSPSWLAAHSLQCIKRIDLYQCKNWRRIPHLAQLPHLEYLEMWHMDLVVDLTVAFPSLLKLHLRNVSVIFEGISEEGQSSYQNFPKIRKLKCFDCKNFEGLIFPLLLHGIPSTLMKLRIHGPISEELEVELDRLQLTSNIKIIRTW